MTSQCDGWIRNYVDGSYVEPDESSSFDQVDPATGRVLARVHEADKALVDRAVTSARRALDNGWADTPVRERTALLRRAADRIEERFEEFVAAEMADTGKPITQARELDVARAPDELPHLRRHRRRGGTGIVCHGPRGRQAGAELRDPQAARRRRRDRSVEPAAASPDLEGCARARVRKLRGGQALRGNPGDCVVAGRGARRGRPACRRLQRRPWIRCELGRRVPHHAPRYRRRHLHRIFGNGFACHENRCPRGSVRSRSSSAARTPRSCSTTSTSTRL